MAYGGYGWCCCASEPPIDGAACGCTGGLPESYEVAIAGLSGTFGNGDGPTYSCSDCNGVHTLTFDSYFAGICRYLAGGGIGIPAYQLDMACSYDMGADQWTISALLSPCNNTARSAAKYGGSITGAVGQSVSELVPMTITTTLLTITTFPYSPSYDPCDSYPSSIDVVPNLP